MTPHFLKNKVDVLYTVPPAIFAATRALACQILSQKSILTAAPRAPAGPGPCLALVRALALPDSARARSQLPAASCRMATGTIFAASQAGSPSCMHGCMHGISLWMHGCDAEFWLAGCLAPKIVTWPCDMWAHAGCERPRTRHNKAAASFERPH